MLYPQIFKIKSFSKLFFNSSSNYAAISQKILLLLTFYRTIMLPILTLMISLKRFRGSFLLCRRLQNFQTLKLSRFSFKSFAVWNLNRTKTVIHCGAFNFRFSAWSIERQKPLPHIFFYFGHKKVEKYIWMLTFGCFCSDRIQIQILQMSLKKEKAKRIFPHYLLL